VAGSAAGRVTSSMKNRILKQTCINLAVVLLVSLLGACAATDTSRRPLTASRDSAGPVRDPDIITGGVRIPVETYYNWPPIGDNNPR
jgi:hypothetical protein